MIDVHPKAAKFNGKTLITGFHGIGATGYWAVKYLIEKLETNRIACIDSDHVAAVSTCYNGHLVTPCELYEHKSMVFLRAVTPPEKVAEVTFFREISEWIANSGFKEVVLIGGLDLTLKDDESTFRIVHTSKWKPRSKLEDAQKLQDDRLIVGPVAILLNYFEMTEFPALAILSYAAAERVDPRGAANALEALSKYLKFDIDVKPLIKGAEEMESQISKNEGTRERGFSEHIYT